jgi:hypothetical protein
MNKNAKEMNTEKMEEYLYYLNEKSESHMKRGEKEEWCNNEELSKAYDLIKNKWNVQQLKSIAKQYKLKISGNKNELITRIYYHLIYYGKATKIQTLFRGHLQRKYNYYHGPAFLKREICTNKSDFLSMEDMKTLPYSQFISYEDTDGFVYGFDIISLYNLLVKSGKEAKNPYNRNAIPAQMMQMMKNMIRISKIMKIPIDIEIEEIQVTQQKSIELKVLDLFQIIDSLGNYSDPSWFLSLNRNELQKFMRELIDIWNYRAQISDEAKKNICPPHGDPFRGLLLHQLYQIQNISHMQSFILPVLEKLVKTGIDKDSKSLGAYYILGALTLVNENAALSLPWLFQSVSYA